MFLSHKYNKIQKILSYTKYTREPWNDKKFDIRALLYLREAERCMSLYELNAFIFLSKIDGTLSRVM